MNRVQVAQHQKINIIQI